MSQPKDVYQAIYKSLKSERSKKSLQALQEVCQELFEAGAIDFRISTIAKLGANRGVPSAQTIRNKPGEPYRALIDAWEKLGESRRREKTRHITPAGQYDWIDRINDPSIKFLVLDLMAQVRHLQSENRLMASINTLEIDLRRDSNNSTDKPLPTFMEHELDALKAAIDENFLEKQGWVKGDRGCIRDAQDKVIFKNGWVYVIEKILSINHG
ncbi:MAG: gamma-mobile-trio protein GmtX [Pseudohongiella sp.]|nr:gamma-mobile-trio protein GmtX [Pseudohongiella sp.]